MQSAMQVTRIQPPPAGQRRNCRGRLQVRNAAEVSGGETSVLDAQAEPLLLRALKGEAVDRSPVWMMRQAGRYMKAYQDLCKQHPSFRERSENVDLSVQISLQPWKAFKPDGVILFSDILTPLTAMNIPFDIVPSKGPIIPYPIRTLEQIGSVTKFDPEQGTSFVGETLQILKKEIGNEATLLGFVGAPFTLSSYIVEGGSSRSFQNVKRLAFSEPEVFHALLKKLADNITDYMRYQADNGAQVIQVFDSWASNLSPQDFDVFSGPYITEIIQSFKSTHSHIPVILYISGSGGLLERMAKCGADVLSIDGSVDMKDAVDRVGKDTCAFQGNLDPGALFGSESFITQRIVELVKLSREVGFRHVMNLGHGVLPATPEENVGIYFEVAKNIDNYIN
eukprot:TRINITY_DN14256_c0_g1_i1.p1 TRINITY_DN14256_c0_g1~~TRINITY_DN14256_c0_g1_i1.p1  ORF type:complete len:394 (+),score=46.29 TRINITY_DN14256_c0_g1_i1:61-1242(+)